MSLQKKYEAIGGQFISSENTMREKLENIRAYIFDWDGVFNDGTKSNELGSPFSEPDSMGVNMLRFSHWLKYGELPFVFIVTGEKNISAVKFAEREHFHGVYLSFKSKKEALNHIGEKHALTPKQMTFFFDDIIDLDAAEMSALSLFISRKNNPLFSDYVMKNNLCDYLSAHPGGQHAVRETTELLIGLHGNFDETISKRIKFEGEYERYLAERNMTVTRTEVRGK